MGSNAQIYVFIALENDYEALVEALEQEGTIF